MSNRATRILGAAVRVTRQRWERGVERLTLPRFATEAAGFEMRLPRTVVQPERMRIGRDVKLGPNSELKCQTVYPGGWMRHPSGEHVAQRFEPTLVIGDRVTATSALQVLAFASVVIEDDVMFAANVFIADGTHANARTDVPYKYQGVGPLGPVRIGRGSWIGQNVVVTPGVTIGEMAVIGANSVVVDDVPARAIAVGAPARVIRRWSEEDARWVRVPGRERA